MSPSRIPESGPLHVVVLFGGVSSEHGVSCLTARNVVEVIDADRYDITAVGITAEGQWVRCPGQIPDAVEGAMPSVDPSWPPFALDDLRAADVVFPLLHGPFGEDGTVQGLLELLGVRYVGSGVLASATGMDKPFTKALFAAGGLQQLPYVTVLPGQMTTQPDRVLARIHALGMPVFVKPARAGSSSGVTMVTSPDELGAAIAEAATFDPKVVVEAAARGKRELEVGVLQLADGTLMTSQVGEVVAATDAHEFYDFDQKYLDGSAQNVVPADVSTTVSEQIRGYAKQAFEAIGAEGLARVDFFWTDDGLVINEINTMPGFTRSSMFPVLWAGSGMGYAELVEHLISLALQRPIGLR